MRTSILLTLLLAPVPATFAQQPVPDTTRAPADSAAHAASTVTVIGTVFDSIRGRVMSGAHIQVDSSGRAALADADGHFRIEGIAPGAHQLWVQHAVLDTLGIVLRTPRDTFRAGETREYDLATPAPTTLIALLCPPAWRARGPGALVGSVHEADTGNPAVGAKVSLVWYEMELSSGVRNVPRVREATVGADGSYRICGLPESLEGKVQVLRGALTSGDVPVKLGDPPFLMRSLTIASPGSVVTVELPQAEGDTSPPRTVKRMLGTARLTGRVLTASGTPLANARVQVMGTLQAAPTHQDGEFTLDSLPAGTQAVSVRLLGYAPVEQAVELASNETRTVTIQMSEFVPVLGAIRVTAQRERGLDAVGFTRRKRVGQGYYLDEKDINHDARTFSDALRMVPGLRIVPLGMGQQAIISQRSPNGCMAFWIDGTQWREIEPGDIDEFVRPYELAAVEVYSGTTAPAQFQTPGGGSCTTVVAWTYHHLETKK